MAQDCIKLVYYGSALAGNTLFLIQKVEREENRRGNFENKKQQQKYSFHDRLHRKNSSKSNAHLLYRYVKRLYGSKSRGNHFSPRPITFEPAHLC